MQDDYSGIGHGGFPHTKQVRIDYIKKLGEPVRRGYKIPGESGLHDVYAVDFDYLIYNFDNGRYFTDKKTRENELGRDVFDNESHLIQATNIIENILWDENEEENELTIKDLLKNRQEIPGVADLSGIVVSGNRRLRLLHEIRRRRQKGDYNNSTVSRENLDSLQTMLVVILPNQLTKQQILDYESRLQYGEKGKLDYNAIEKYFIVQRLIDNKVPPDTILSNNSQMPNLKGRSDIDKFIRVCVLMEEYLSSISKPGVYTELDSAEDYFRRLDDDLNALDTGRVHVRGMHELVKEQYKKVFFTIIRARKIMKGKKYRELLGIYDKNQLEWERLLNQVDKSVVNKSYNESLDSTASTSNSSEQIWVVQKGQKIKDLFEDAIDDTKIIIKFEEPDKLLGNIIKDMEKVNRMISGEDGQELIKSYGIEMKKNIDEIYSQLNSVLNRLPAE